MQLGRDYLCSHTTRSERGLSLMRGHDLDSAEVGSEQHPEPRGGNLNSGLGSSSGSMERQKKPPELELTHSASSLW